MDAIRTFLGVKLSFFIAFFSLNYVTISTNNKMHNENPASTDSLAGSKRIFLHSICLERARTSEPHLTSSQISEPCINLDMSRLMQQVRDQVFDKKSRKRVESMSQTRTNLSKTWLQT